MDTAISTSTGRSATVPADLRNDGLTDIVAGEWVVVSVLFNQVTGKFVDGLWVPLAGSGNCGAAADFNGDGKPDLAVPTSQGVRARQHDSHESRHTGAGRLQPRRQAGCGRFLESVGPLGNGDGTFQRPVIIWSRPPDGGYDYIAAGDVNNDGWTDLLLTNFVQKSLFVLLNNQQGGFTQTVVINDDAPDAVTLADVNGDGNLDAVVMMEQVPLVYLYLGNGHGGFTMVRNTIPYGWHSQAPATVGDVNGDGIPDLLLPTGENVGISLGTGGGVFAPPVHVGTGPASYQIVLENLHGQPPTSGPPDLVAPDSSGGVMVLINTTKE